MLLAKCPPSILSGVMWSVDAFIEWCTSSWKIRPENRRISKNPTFFSPKCCSCIYFDVSIIHLFKYDSNFSICNLKVFKIWIFWKWNGQKLMHWFASHRELCRVTERLRYVVKKLRMDSQLTQDGWSSSFTGLFSV